jgi:hypothetical protein
MIGLSSYSEQHVDGRRFEINIHQSELNRVSIQHIRDVAAQAFESNLGYGEFELIVWSDLTKDGLTGTHLRIYVNSGDDGTHIGSSISPALAYDDDYAQSIIESIFTPVDASFDGMQYDREDEPCWYYHAKLNDPEIAPREIFRCAEDAQNQLAMTNVNPLQSLTKQTLIYKLRAGKFEDIIGERERGWVDFKSALNIESTEGKIELARDITRFANSEDGGVLVIGYRTKNVNGSDIVTKLTPIVSNGFEGRIRRILDHYSYPPVRRLEVSEFEVDGGRSIVAISVPPQREGDKPFLVHGAIVEGKAKGEFISIVRRRGEDSIPTTAREIHAFLSAGYNLIRNLKNSWPD